LTPWTTPAGSWRSGVTITTPSGRTHRWGTKHRPKRAGRLSNLRAPRPARLPSAKPTTTRIKPADSRHERGTSRGQVNEKTLAGGLSIPRAILAIGVPLFNSCQIEDFLCPSIGRSLVINTVLQIQSSTLCCSDRLNPSPLILGGLSYNANVYTCEQTGDITSLSASGNDRIKKPFSLHIRRYIVIAVS